MDAAAAKKNKNEKEGERKKEKTRSMEDETNERKNKIDHSKSENVNHVIGIVDTVANQMITCNQIPFAMPCNLHYAICSVFFFFCFFLSLSVSLFFLFSVH